MYRGIINLTVKNDMQDDTPVFSLVLVGTERWNEHVRTNDRISIRVIPDVTKPAPPNPYIMVGLVSHVLKEGEYEDGRIVYRISGRAMSKALMDFNVGVIQEVSTVISDVGWLPDTVEGGLNFSGRSAAEIANELMTRFVYTHMNYTFEGGQTITDYFTHNFDSWTEDESLADATPFINYEGSMRQFLEDITQRPFNELFFDYTDDGRCVAIMRKTPFDPEQWNSLPSYRFTSDIVVQESLGQDDSEAHSIFVVQPTNILDFNTMDLGVYPLYHPSLVDKYGYKRLDAENRYLMGAGLDGTEEDSGSSDDGDSDSEPEYTPPPFDAMHDFLSQNNLLEPEAARTESEMMYNEIISNFPGLSSTAAYRIIEVVENGEFSRDTYNEASLLTDDAARNREIAAERSESSEKLARFTQRLFNWFADNPNFTNGEIRVLGHPAYRVGVRTEYHDFEMQNIWEFYVESIQHEFSYDSGYTTVIGVTRGLPSRGADRFSMLWGQSEDFLGGYLGELSIQDMLEEAERLRVAQEEARRNALGGGGDGGWAGGAGAAGGDVAMAAMQAALAQSERNSIYIFGGGRTGTDPFTRSPIRVDCSSFVWWVYKTVGVTLRGGPTGMNTDTIKVDPQLQTVSRRGSSKSNAMDQLLRGDIVYWDTYKNDGHMGIYIGNGRFVGAQSSTGIATADMTSGYWWRKFNGHVLRYRG
jgi:cell wall-associated NlpC family hydrolase